MHSLAHILPRTNSMRQPSLLCALSIVYNFNPRSSEVAVLCDVFCTLTQMCLWVFWWWQFAAMFKELERKCHELTEWPFIACKSQYFFYFNIRYQVNIYILKKKELKKARRRQIIPLLIFYLFIPFFFNSIAIFLFCSFQTQAHQSTAVSCEIGLNLAK